MNPVPHYLCLPNPERHLEQGSITAKIAKSWKTIETLYQPWTLFGADYRTLRRERKFSIKAMQDWEAAGFGNDFASRLSWLLLLEDNLYLAEAEYTYPVRGWAYEFAIELMFRESLAQERRAETAIDLKTQQEHLDRVAMLSKNIEKLRALKPEQVNDFVDNWGIMNKIRHGQRLGSMF